MTDKKKQLPLATFRIAPDKADVWEKFKAKVEDNKTTGAALFWQFVQNYVDGVDTNIDVSTYHVDSNLEERIDSALEAKADFLIGNISRVADEQYERLVGVVAQNMIDIDERIDAHIEAAQQSLLSGDGGRLTEIFDRIRVLEVATTAQTQGMEIGIQDVQNMIDVAFSDREERLDSLEEIVRDAISALSRIEAVFDTNSPLIARIETLENNLSKTKVIPQKAPHAIPESEGDSNPEITASVLKPEPLPIIEAIATIAAPTIEKSLDSEGLNEAIAPSAKSKKITYQLNRDGSVILRSLVGTSIKVLKRMTDAELKAIGLFRTLIGANEKFFPIDPNAIASTAKTKSTNKPSKKSDADRKFTLQEAVDFYNSAHPSDRPLKTNSLKQNAKMYGFMIKERGSGMYALIDS